MMSIALFCIVALTLIHFVDKAETRKDMKR
jgi:hypothetical protein